jgi:hypothetical protein
MQVRLLRIKQHQLATPGLAGAICCDTRQEEPESFKGGSSREEGVLIVCGHFLGDKAAADVRLSCIALVDVNPSGSDGAAARSPPAHLQGNLLPHSPLLHERALLFTGVAYQVAWEVFARELVENPLALISVFSKLLLLVSDPILNRLIIDSHREVIGFLGEVVEARPKAESPKDGTRWPATVPETLSIKPSEDRPTQLGRIHGSSSRSSPDQMLMIVISATPHSQFVKDARC